MPNVDKYEPGSFCWVELATSDAAAAKGFYGELFGWAATDNPMPEGVYTMFQLRGRNVCAAYSMNKQMKEQGVPPHWGSYVSVTSVDESAARAAEIGGKIVAPPFDVLDVGRMAVLQDPTGATLSLWQAKKHIGAEVTNDTGAMCWHELYTRDPDAAKKFYGGLFGWTSKTDAGGAGGPPYTEFKAGDKTRGGMMAILPEMGPMPPSWMVYFTVEDTDASVGRATRMGGKVLVPPMDVPNVGRFSVLADPQGAAFSIIKLSAQYAT